MRRYRRAKIVATLGPASSSPETIRALFDAGADVFRFNFSHGTHEDHRQRYEIVRAIEQETGRPISVLADLQGPKLRIGKLAAGPIMLEEGTTITFDLDPEPGTLARVPLPHPEVFAALSPGVTLLIDDGKLRLTIEKAEPQSAVAKVVTGGPLSERKGVSIVGAVLPVSALTEKDRKDLAFALELGADWIALSFVQRAEDLDEVRALANRPIALMAKLEKPSAIDGLEAIIARSDAVMVARGDLGVEMEPERVPIVQRRIVHAARGAGKPVIVATQMLESMITTPTPTRAEASDVATAIYEGADAVMLSAETASGRYPIEAVTMMNKIITAVEQDPVYREGLDATGPTPQANVSDVICSALHRSAAILPVAALVTYTTSGLTSLRTARERPAAPILSLTPELAIARRLALVWGTHPVLSRAQAHVTDIVEDACAATEKEGLAIPGDIIAIAGGMPFGVSGTTNLLRIAQVPSGAAAK
ncbi:pyruvate kinase [Beijerinckia indica]|uniref:Pyruvate kinase n=1 Tax=Beijerinckia indica subsp. indica (strain ATCC 9039 / DSM 1715 / NCIMB 8712) TaxID=395963 RepID=B2IKE7_BEII9|nr:pyruvate kinase [Beijerinckia indica]ACB96427.1 pyruvate kinase [Beijerinckia indica subsp. indica ATCC 9039]